MRMGLAAILFSLLIPADGPAGRVSGKVVLLKSGSPLSDASGAVVWIEGLHSGFGTVRELSPVPGDQKKE